MRTTAEKLLRVFPYPKLEVAGAHLRIATCMCIDTRHCVGGRSVGDGRGWGDGDGRGRKMLANANGSTCRGRTPTAAHVEAVAAAAVDDQSQLQPAQPAPRYATALPSPAASSGGRQPNHTGTRTDLHLEDGHCRAHKEPSHASTLAILQRSELPNLVGRGTAPCTAHSARAARKLTRRGEGRLEQQIKDLTALLRRVRAQQCTCCTAARDGPDPTVLLPGGCYGHVDRGGRSRTR